MCRRSICFRPSSVTAAARGFIAGCARKPGLSLESRPFPTRRAILGCLGSTPPWNRSIATRRSDSILEIVAEFQQNGVDRGRTGQGEKNLTQPSLGSLTTMRGQASDLGSNWFVTRNLNFTRDYLEADAEESSLEDIQRVAAQIFGRGKSDCRFAQPARHVSREDDAKQTAVSAGEVAKFELSNGLRLLVREDPRLPLVSMVAVFRGGLLAETPATNGITRLMAKVLRERHEDSNGRTDRRHDRSGRRQHRQRRGEQQFQCFARSDPARSATRRGAAVRHPAQRHDA